MARQPEDEEERIAREWLKQQGYTNIERPDEDPPDLVVDGKYAVEVRRLNPIIEIDGQKKGEEERREPLREAIESALNSFGSSINGRGFSVSWEYDYSGSPLPQPEALEQQIIEALQSFCDEVLQPGQFPSCLQPRQLKLKCGICLVLQPGNQELSMFSSDGKGVSDGKGCWLLDEVGKSLQHSIEEKCHKICRKIAEQESLYRDHEWWLLLIYRMFDIPLQFLLQDDMESLSREVRVQKPVSRVIVISPENLEWFYEFPESRGTENG